MKLRVEDNSIRFRITSKELERLNARGRIESAAQLFSTDGSTLEGEFIYALAVDTEGGDSRCLIEPSYIMMVLSPEALEALNNGGEGFVFRRESVTPEGVTKRFIAYVERDRPGKKRKRPEQWLETEE